MVSIEKKDYSAEKRLSLRSSLISIETMRIGFCEVMMTGKMKGKFGKKSNKADK